MHLPEAVARDAPGTSRSLLVHPHGACRPTVDRDDRVTCAAGGDAHLDGARPGLPQHAGCEDGGVCDRAGLQELEVVRTVPAQPEAAGHRFRSEPLAGAPAETVWSP